MLKNRKYALVVGVMFVITGGLTGVALVSAATFSQNTKKETKIWAMRYLVKTTSKCEVPGKRYIECGWINRDKLRRK